jgi:polyvinyl alcohol dehydrogenase (cytochrome)
MSFGQPSPRTVKANQPESDLTRLKSVYRRGVRWFAAGLAGLAGFTLLVGCSSSTATPKAHPSSVGVARPSASVSASASGTDWVTYHHDPGRSGMAANVPAPGHLTKAWQARLDGAVYGQPLAVGDTVIAATEGDTVYALDRRTGAVRWKHHLATPVPLSALPCGDIDPLGITSTAVYDPKTATVYVVAETTGFHHVLFGLALADGATRIRRDIVTPGGAPVYDQQRAALTFEDGRVYVPFGGLYGDCGTYVGSIIGVPVDGTGSTVAFHVPTHFKAAMWAPGGPVIGPDGTLYMSAGNGSPSGSFDGSDSVTALTPALHRISVFAPTTWKSDNANDLDLGSLSPAVLPGGRVFIDGKLGEAYLLRTPNLGGVGGQLTQARVCEAYGGTAHSGSIVYVPCMNGGLAAVDTAGDRIKVKWRGPDASGSPVLGGGAVWVDGPANGMLYALSAADGRVLQRISVAGSLPHFESPTLSGDLALVGTTDGVVAVAGA